MPLLDKTLHAIIQFTLDKYARSEAQQQELTAIISTKHKALLAQIKGNEAMEVQMRESLVKLWQYASISKGNILFITA
jgi:hypothetical protein